jgi:hypothetical protein
MTQLGICARGLLLYAFLTSATVLVGLGLLRLLGIKLNARTRGLLAPIVTLVFWSLALGVCGALRIPVKQVSPWLWSVSAFIALLGLRPLGAVIRETWSLLLLSGLLPVAVMASNFWYGLSDYAGSIATDGWSYIACGQYLWEYSRGTAGGLVPLHEFASAMSDSRWVSFSLLAFFSPLIHAGDTQSVCSLYQAWTLFVMSCGVGLFWVALNPREWMIVTALILSTVAGWITNLVWAYNLDNGLALAYLPALAGGLLLVEARTMRWWVLFGALGAGILYTYPELAPLVLAGALIIALPRLWRERHDWPIWLRGTAIGLAVASVLLLPAVKDLLEFWQGQIGSLHGSSIRPGEGFFRGLLDPRFQLGAFWGLGGEHRIIDLNGARVLLGAALILLLIVGLAATALEGHWGLSALCTLLTVGALYFIIRHHYSYGAYKLIVLNWWCMIAAMIIGTNWIMTKLRAPALRVVAGTGLTVLAAVTILQSNHTQPEITAQYNWGPTRNQKRVMANYREVCAIDPLVRSSGLLVAVHDWLANEWAVYFLRGVPLYLDSYYAYMAGDPQRMQRAQAPPVEQLSWMLTDTTGSAEYLQHQGWELSWAGSVYRLWKAKAPDWAIITHCGNVQQLRATDGGLCFCLGSDEAILDVLVNREGTLTLRGTVSPGSDEPADRWCHIGVQSEVDHCEATIVPAREAVFSIPVTLGKNRIRLRWLDRIEDGQRHASGGPQPALLKVSGLTASLQCADHPVASSGVPTNQ